MNCFNLKAWQFLGTTKQAFMTRAYWTFAGRGGSEGHWNAGGWRRAAVERWRGVSRGNASGRRGYGPLGDSSERYLGIVSLL